MKNLKFLPVFLLLILLSGCGGLFTKTVTVYVEVPVPIEIPGDFLQPTPIPKKNIDWTDLDSQGDVLAPYIGDHKQAIKTGNTKLQNVKAIIDDFNKKAKEAQKKK